MGDTEAGSVERRAGEGEAGRKLHFRHGLRCILQASELSTS